MLDKACLFCYAVRHRTDAAQRTIKEIKMLPAGSYQPAEISFLDAGNEVGTCRFFGSILNAGNMVAKTALWAALLTATDEITLGARKKDIYNDETLYLVSQPTNGAARETKLLVQFMDSTTGERMTTSIPTLTPTLPLYVVNINARDVVRMDAPTEIVDFIGAFNDFAVNPRNGNATVVVGLEVVGRNL
jgi:hypothetical protein